MAVGLQAIHRTDPTGRRGDLVLVHGLDGDAITTWQPKGRPDHFWPAWLAEDLPDLGIWTLAYDAPLSQWRRTASPLIDLATAALSTLDAHGIGQRPVIFVAHSLGGLLVKQMLRHATSYGNASWLALHDAVRGIVFLSTPHAGSQTANWFLHVGSVLRTSVSVKELGQEQFTRAWEQGRAMSLEQAVACALEEGGSLL
jgi:triacylglycerol esterase/lipase EstA (alpha/beta hydrolase family)